MALTQDYIQQYVLSSLGVDSVAVELSPNDLQFCVEDSMRTYNRYNPKRDIESERIQGQGIRSFTLPRDCYAVIDVEMQNPAQVLEQSDPSYFNIFNNFFLVGGGAGSYTPGITGTQEYSLYQMWRQMTMKEFSLDPDYWIEEDQQYDETNPSLALPKQIHFFNPTGLTLRVMYTALSNHAIEEILPRDEDWILEYALAHGKQILGYKRRKHKVIPSAGQQLQLDGVELVEESKEEKQRLKQEMMARIPLPPPIWG